MGDFAMMIEKFSEADLIPKVCGGYLRVSSPQPKSLAPQGAVRKPRYAPQQENSLPRQRDSIIKFHRMLELPEPLVLFEDDQSGGNRKRKQFRKLIEWIYADRISTVLIENDSRLARDVLMTEELIQLCFNRRVRVGIWSWKGYVDWENPIHRQSLRVSAVTSQLQRDQMRRMSLDGTQRSLELGRSVGAVPFGYQVGPDKRLVRDPIEFPLLLRMAAEIRTKGCPRIAKSLELERRAGIIQGRYQHRPWRPSDIQRCLQNPVITGQIVRYWRDDRSGKITPRESWKFYPKAHDAVVTLAEFDEIQAIIAARRMRPVGVAPLPQRRMPYTGLIRCGHHARPMGGHTRRRRREQVWVLICPELNCPNSEMLLSDMEVLLDRNLTPELNRALSEGEFGEVTRDRLNLRMTECRDALAVATREIRCLGEQEASLIERFALGNLDEADLAKEQEAIEGARIPLKARASMLQASLMAQEKLLGDIEDKRANLLRLAVPLHQMEETVKADLIPNIFRGIEVFERSRVNVAWLHQPRSGNAP